MCDAESKNVGLRAMHECFLAAVAAGLSSVLIAQADRQRSANTVSVTAKRLCLVASLVSYWTLAR